MLMGVPSLIRHQSGVARNTACHRTPKWLARRPEALRPGGSVLRWQAVFRATPLFPHAPRDGASRVFPRFQVDTPYSLQYS